ncbi:hypothetical protein LXT21_29070 [Myxococcus sp. K38C18041901]|uniref:hypothetical protein n=1 Tax=Myxococcus guangdongensis TaxID=2906760 RepID=UPI0020A6F21B|nr:hypothetical protein [Myxococcus guangdongensis]MCP3062844.1 hypothetical protein [Myxococcus guangdongensis]
MASDSAAKARANPGGKSWRWYGCGVLLMVFVFVPGLILFFSWLNASVVVPRRERQVQARIAGFCGEVKAGELPEDALERSRSLGYPVRLEGSVAKRLRIIRFDAPVSQMLGCELHTDDAGRVSSTKPYVISMEYEDF